MSILSFIPTATAKPAKDFQHPSLSEPKFKSGVSSFDQFLKNANEKQFKNDPFLEKAEQFRSVEREVKQEPKKEEFKTADQSQPEKVVSKSTPDQEADVDHEAKEASQPLNKGEEKEAAKVQNEADQKNETPVDVNQEEILALLAQLAQAEAVIRGETQPETIQIAELTEAMANAEPVGAMQGTVDGSLAEGLKPVENQVKVKLNPETLTEGKGVNLGQFNQALAQISENTSQSEGESLFNQGQNPNANSLISESVKLQNSNQTMEDENQSVVETFLGANASSQKADAEAQLGKDRVLAQHDQSSAKSGKVNLAVIQTHLAVNDTPEVKTEMPGMNLVPSQPIVSSSIQVQTSGATGAAPTSREELFSQLVEHAKVVVNNGGSEMEVNLRPEHLGKIQLKVTIENEAVTAKFVAESQQVKEIIESNLNQLKRNLQENGMQVDAIMVSVGNHQGSEGFEQAANQEGFSHFKGSNGKGEEELNMAAEDRRPQAQIDAVIDLIA